jgi:small GTP-binding protein
MTEDRLKIVVFGAFNAGKSTFIHTLDPEARHTEADIVGGTTTVALDFGRILIGDRHVYLFGTPGQERFEFAREIISRGIDGAIVIVDATADVDEFTGHVCRGLRAAGIPRVVALNKCDCDDACPEHIRTSLGSEEESICISALSREDAYRALEHLVNHIHSCHTNHRFRYVPG